MYANTFIENTLFFLSKKTWTFLNLKHAEVKKKNELKHWKSTQTQNVQ